MANRFRVVLEEVYGPDEDEASEVLASYALGGLMREWKLDADLVASLKEELAKAKARKK
jgi:hypothetical protein